MLAAERRHYILDLLKRDGRIVAQELSTELGVSEDTIRRDLREMAAEGLLQRVHGGALPRSPALVSFRTREAQVSPAKIAVAALAASLIQPGMVVFLGSGTTNVQAAAHLPRDLSATIITNSPPAAVALADHPGVEVVVIGGRLYKHAQVTVGSEAVDAVRRVRADLYLMGVCSLHPELGISIQDLEEANVQRAMIANAAEVAALATAEKMGTAAPYIIGSISDLSSIITDALLPDEVFEPYRAQNVTILRA
ncbi:MAG: DeoR/GlpR family DNA-binding transcription regulator [Anaerolineaceae bacterium]|nr:DeoR/GlpR family DNA-binding transcription regulator [Anaerolineaceae bacterium]